MNWNPQFAAAHERVHRDMMSLPSQEVMAASLHVWTVVNTVLDHLPPIMALRPEVEELLPCALRSVDRLGDYAMGLGHACECHPDEVDRAYTLLIWNYRQVRRAVFFVRYDWGDGEQIAPALEGLRRSEGWEEPASSCCADATCSNGLLAAVDFSQPPPPVSERGA